MGKDCQTIIIYCQSSVKMTLWCIRFAGALFQLSFLRRLEESSGMFSVTSLVNIHDLKLSSQVKLMCDAQPSFFFSFLFFFLVSAFDAEHHYHVQVDSCKIQYSWFKGISFYIVSSSFVSKVKIECRDRALSSIYSGFTSFSLILQFEYVIELIFRVITA